MNWKSDSRLVTAIVASVLLLGCRGPQTLVREIASPAAPGSAEPCIEAGADGRAYLSWIEPGGTERHALRFSTWEGSAWSPPRTVARGSDWFVNWADFPAVIGLHDGTIAAHWLQKTGTGAYAYGVRLSFSRDGGQTWSAPITPHDGSPTEHGFVSMVPLPRDRIAAIWLDGRETAPGSDSHAGSMTLRSAVLAVDGRIEREDLLDARVCDCCQTAAVGVGNDVVVAYRDRSEGEVRDIFVSRFDGMRWTEPVAVHDDRWVIPGCPVNGPALAADGDRVAVAWFTAAGSPPAPTVRIAFSRDGGRSFEAPLDVDAGRPVGRVDVVFLEDGAALVTWIGEHQGSTQILACHVDSNGRRGPHVRIGSTSSERANGFPRTAKLGQDTVIAWTDPGSPSRIRTALLSQER